MRHGTLRSFSAPSSSESIARQLQPAQPDVADAGAQRVGDRRHAQALRRRPGDHRVLGPVSTTKSCARASLTLRADDDLLVHQPKSTV